MKNMKIANKLLFSFTILIAISVMIGISSIVGIRTLARAQEDMYAYNLTSLQEIGNIRANYQHQRVLIRELVIYQPGDEGYSDINRHLSALEDEMGQYIARYKQTIHTPEEQTAFASFETSYNTRFQDLKRQLIAAGEAGGSQAPMVALISSSEALAEEIAGYLTACLDTNIIQARTSIEQSRISERGFIIMEAIVICFGIIAAVAIIRFLNRSIVRPLTEMLTAARQLAAGDIDVAVTAQGHDEAGQLADAFQEMAAMFQLQTTQLNKIAHGDLTADITIQGEHDMIGTGLKVCSDNLNRIMREINTAASQVSTGAGQVSESSQLLAQGASEQAAAIEQLSSSIYEISLNARESAKMSESLAELFGGINSRANESFGLMNDMVEAIDAVGHSTTKISDIMKLMRDISFQTNILSINAAVEAANAGEAGKGFAVVADEVRNLAKQSTQAAADTEALIERCVQTVQNGTAIIQKTHEALLTILQDIVESSRHIDDIAQSAKEQSSSVGQINAGIDQVSKVINLNSSGAEQSAMAAEEMSAMAEHLSGLVAGFKLKTSAVPVNLQPEQKSQPPQLHLPKLQKRPVIVLADEISDKY